MDDGLRISVLGEVGATLEGGAVDLGGRRQRAVLARMVLARGAAVGDGRLVDAVWGTAPPPSASGALQVYISRLRRALEPGRTARDRSGVIIREDTGYALRIPDEAVDAWRFEQAMRRSGALPDPAGVAEALHGALALWRGPAFAEYTAQPWAEPEAARLAELHEVARERLLAARLDLGKSAVLVPEAEALVGQDPLREERWRLLALALYRSHRQADALGALRRARQTLAEELGAEPGAGLRTLEAEVLAQSPALDWTPPPRSAPPGGAPAVNAAATVPAAAPSSLWPGTGADALVDRGPQLAELAERLTGALDGDGGVVLVQGPAGIGKSRLLAEVRRLAAAQKVLTLTARGSRREKDYGFGAVRQLLENLVARRGAELLTGPAAACAAVFDVPGPGGAAAPGEPARAPAGLAVLNGLYRLTAALAAEGPVVLAIDDVQWCDIGSLRFLAHLARNLRERPGLPVLLVLALRTGEPHHNGALPAELTDGSPVLRVPPTPLTVAGITDLIRQALDEAPDEAFAAACHEATSGNPLLLRQLLRALRSGDIRPHAAQVAAVTEVGSRAVSQHVLTRLGRLPERSTAVARAIAVLGDDAALRDVAGVLGLPENDVADALAPLVRAEIIRDQYPLGFVHPLVGDAVYRDLTPGERQLRHERTARVLDAAGAQPERTAAHLLLTPLRGDSWTVGVLRAVARQALGRGAADAAATYLARALDEPPRPDQRPEVLLELGHAEVLGNGPTAVEHLRQAYETLLDPARRARAALTLARTLVFAGGPGQATAFARRAGAELPADLTDVRQGLLALERTSAFMHGLRLEPWRDAGIPAATTAGGPGARMLAANVAREAAHDGSDRVKAVELARFAVADGVLLDAGEEMLWFTAVIVLHLAGEDDERVAGLLDEAQIRAQERGSLFSVLATNLWRGFAQWNHGALGAAHHSLTTAVELSETWGLAPGAPQGRTFMTGLLLDLGDTEGARGCLERMRGWVTGPEGTRLLGESEARVLMAEGRYEEALPCLDRVRHLQPPVGNPAWWPWGLLRVQALAGLGERAEAERLAAAQLDIARGWGAPGTRGRALRVLGELRGSEVELQEAVALLAPGPARLEYARALYALALHGPAAQAGAALQEAHTVAERCGAEGLLRSVEAAQACQGAKSGRRPSGPWSPGG